MKKITACILTLVMLLTLGVPAFAEGEPYQLKNTEIPVVVIGGDGEPLYDTDGNRVFKINELMGLTDSIETENLAQSILNVLVPFLLNGLGGDSWDRYYENLQKEVGELTAAVQLDNNGEPSNGTDIAQSRYDTNARNMSRNNKGSKGYYGYSDYHYWYDWRLDPIFLADQLHEYVEAVMGVTHSNKVSFIGHCVGINVILAYVAKYGTEQIHGIAIDGSSVNGGEFISEALSGKFKVDGVAIGRYLEDGTSLGRMNLPPIVTSTLDLLTKSGVLERITGVAKETIYEKVAEGVTSALALSTFFTMPCYWGFVTAEDYPEAIRYVFGEEGSEKRQEYAGLIEKLDRYHETVRLQLPELMGQIKDDGLNLGIIAKYGFQIVPVCQSNDVVGDEYASVHLASFGATTSTIYDTLSDDYIAQRVAEGKGKYISPDKQIDASTCMYPDFTWFTKGARHANWTQTENDILYEVSLADRQLTVDDFPYTQFMVLDKETNLMIPMTEENCHTENWSANADVDYPTTKENKLRSFLQSLFQWLITAFNFIRDRFFK